MLFALLLAPIGIFCGLRDVGHYVGGAALAGGRATFIGVLLALNWMVGVAVCLTWLLAAVVTRTSSIAALVAAAASGLFVLVLTDGSPLILTMILTVLVYVRHWENLQRIKAGTEPKIGAKKA